ncbi:MAG: Uma2 family endonuclease [Lachnospiraceae bacterium]|nr:Uma2 family endonuclease [Lachnospiraceae bacterium]
MGITLADILRIKTEKGYNVVELSEYSGVPVETLQKFLEGDNVNMMETALPALEKVLLDDEKSYTYQAHIGSNMVAEAQSHYSVEHAEKRQGEYTLEDYYNMPEDRRVELIDGVIYDMSAPTPLHQMIAGMVYARILAFIEKKKGNCIPFIAPADVQLDCDTRTMVQPDVFIVCKKDRLKRFGIYGAPDFVLEILSGSTRKKDMTVKLTKYMEAGVREYWVIDPEKRLLIVYIGEEEGIPRLYPLQGAVGVNLYSGELQINLNEINDLIDQFGSMQE